MIQIKRAYEEPDKNDGTRILVDRLWPRGKTKEAMQLAWWAKEISPSNELRKEFGGMAERFEEFKEAYLAELDHNPKLAEFVENVKEAQSKGTVTFVYASKDLVYNHANVLREWLDKSI